MTSPFEKFVGREVIYFERGHVAACRIRSVFAEDRPEELSGFELEVQRWLEHHSPIVQPLETEPELLRVSPQWVREEDGLIVASGYIARTIVVDPDKIDEIMTAIGKAGGEKGDWTLSPYGICRAATDESFRKRVQKGVL